MKPKLKYLAWVTWDSFRAHCRHRNPQRYPHALGYPKQDFNEDLKKKEQERGNIIVKEIKGVLGNFSTMMWF